MVDDDDDIYEDASQMGFVIILHTQHHRGQATLWAVPASRARETAKVIAYQSVPTEALHILGPADLELVNGLVDKLTQVLSDAGVTIIEESLADD